MFVIKNIYKKLHLDKNNYKRNQNGTFHFNVIKHYKNNISAYRYVRRQHFVSTRSFADLDLGVHIFLIEQNKLLQNNTLTLQTVFQQYSANRWLTGYLLLYCLNAKNLSLHKKEEKTIKG